jgi:hydrogenase maturation protein HypF
MNERRHITVEGMVQGVGFRPFVYGQAMKNRQAGFVINDAAGVTNELEGTPPALEKFLAELREQPPPFARIENVGCRTNPPKG